MADRSAVTQDIDGSGRSATTIIQDVVRDVGEMVRSELRLAKAEMTDKARQAGKGAGMLGGAAICGVFAGACFVAFCVWALALAMPWGIGALLMAVVLVCAGGAMYAGGCGKLKQVDPAPRQTIETLKEQIR